MFDGLETGAGLDIVLRLQAWNNPLFDLIARALHLAGTDLFFLPILSLIYWTFNRPLGLRLLFALALSTMLTALLKALFQLPRPPDISADVVPLVAQGGYGLPSGHVLTALVVWGDLARWTGRRWLYVVVGGYVLLMAWARMYAGVHFPQDVVAGAVFGLLALRLYGWLAGWLPGVWARLTPKTRFWMVVLAAIVCITFLFPSRSGLSQTGALVGAGLALCVDRWTQFDVRGTLRQRALRGWVCFAAALVVFATSAIVLIAPDAGASDAGAPDAGAESIYRLGYVPVFALTVFCILVVSPRLARWLGLLAPEAASSAE